MTYLCRWLDFSVPLRFEVDVVSELSDPDR